MYDPNFELKTEFTREVYEHEVLISFNSDNDAVAFNDWIEGEGREAFTHWREEHKEDYV